MAAIALDIGGTKIEGAIFSADGTRLDGFKELIGERTGDAVGALAIRICHTLMERAASHEIAVSSIGVCVPGIVHRGDGTVWAPNIPGWDNYPLRHRLAEEFGGISISVDSDRSCCIYGESWIGAAAGCRDAVFIAVGTGIGLGIKVDGHVLHGFGDIAGAAGWMAMEPYHNPEFDRCGCFEYYASGTGIGHCGRAALEKAGGIGPEGFGGASSIGEIRAENVFAAADDGNPVACGVIDKAIEMWGMGAANLISLLNPEYLIWGGGVFGPAVRYLDRIRAEAARRAQPIAMRQVKFVPSSAGINPILAGAAYIAFHHNNL